MLTLLKSRDSENLAKIIREHIRGTKAVILATYGETA